MSLTLYTGTDMEVTPRPAEARFAIPRHPWPRQRMQWPSAAAAIGRTADAATAILRAWTPGSQGRDGFTKTYLEKLTPMLDELLKLIP